MFCCFQRVIAMWEPLGGISTLSPKKHKMIYWLLLDKRVIICLFSAREFFFVSLWWTCAPILQPNLKAGVNLFGTQQEREKDDDDEYAFIFKSVRSHSSSNGIELEGISFDIWFVIYFEAAKAREI